MPKGKEKTFTETLVDFALDNKAEHQKYMSRLTPDTLAAVIGRKGRLTVAGEDGGVFIFRVTAGGIFKDDSPTDIRNEIWMEDTIFQDIVTGELDPKVARARNQIVFTGDRSLYDSSEIMKLFDEWMNIRLKPIAQRMMRAMTGEGQ